jgi:hypothetical protein
VRGNDRRVESGDDVGVDRKVPTLSELPEFLTVNQAAAYLRVNRNTVYTARFIAGRYRAYDLLVVGYGFLEAVSRKRSRSDDSRGDEGAGG